MKLISITEPETRPEAPHQIENIAVGIDLGTTNSAIAISYSNHPVIIKDRTGEKLLPSVVFYAADGQTLVGKTDAYEEAKASNIVISSVKRLMGLGGNDESLAAKILPHLKSRIIVEPDSPIIKLDIKGKALSAVEISAEILKSLKRRAEEELGKPVQKAVITVPAYFDDAARVATKDAARLAGLEVLRLINEPTAAALAYGLDKGAEGIYTVYDLGGGTFDVSLLRMSKGVFQVIATRGDTALGGDDFDHAMAYHIASQQKITDNWYQTHIDQFLQQARIIKEKLSYDEQVEHNFTVDGRQISVMIDRKEFAAIIDSYIEKTINIMRDMLEDADINDQQVSGVVLVGGSTRIPLIKQKLREKFGFIIFDDVNPDEVVALGAAIQAEALTRGSGNLLLDVVPLSLGLEVMGGVAERIIARNMAIPLCVSKEFTTYQDGQTAMWFHIVQGEREMAADNRSLARFELSGIPAMKAGMARVRITFTVDADGLLTVSAMELTTGLKQEVEVKPSYGLDEGEITRMLRESLEYADADVRLKLLTETKVEAELMLATINDALDTDKELLSSEEMQMIRDQVQKTKQALETNNRPMIQQNMELLDKISTEFMSKKVDKYLNKALKGQSMDKIEEIFGN